MHKEALGLADNRVARQRLGSETVASALLCCLLPVVQVTPDQPSLHMPETFKHVPLHTTALHARTGCRTHTHKVGTAFAKSVTDSIWLSRKCYSAEHAPSFEPGPQQLELQRGGGDQVRYDERPWITQNAEEGMLTWRLSKALRSSLWRCTVVCQVAQARCSDEAKQA